MRNCQDCGKSAEKISDQVSRNHLRPILPGVIFRRHQGLTRPAPDLALKGMTMQPPPTRVRSLPIAAVLLAAGAACGQTATFQPVPHGLTTTEFYPVSVSNDGLKVGGYFGDDLGIYHGFRWSAAGGFLQFPDLCPAVPATRLFRISGNGNAAVGEMNYCGQDPECPECGETGPGIWDEEFGTTYIGLLPGGVPEFEAAMALDVSADGTVVVGYSSVTDPDTGDEGTHAFRWTRVDGIEDLGLPANAQFSRAVGISDDGQTVLVDALLLILDGEGQVLSTPNVALLWRQGEGYTTLPVPAGFDDMVPMAISGDGTTVVGIAATAIGVTPARSEVFRWRAGTGTQVLGARPDLGRPNSVPWNVNGDGSVIIGDLSGAHPWIPFLWTEADGFRPFTEVLTAGGADYTGWEITAVHAVSADGRTLVGSGFREHPEFGTVVDGWVATLSGGTACPADWDGSGGVNSTDISGFLASWLDSVQSGNLNADFNGDASVNSTDISAYLAAWLQAVQEGC